MNVAFPEATQLAQEAEVRISGREGRQGAQGRAERGHRAHRRGRGDRLALRADLQGHARGPAPEDAAGGDLRRARAGQPGRRRRARCPTAAALPRGQVADTVQLDEILRTFDPETRERFSTWLDQQGRSATGNGEAINDALGNLTPFAENTDDVLEGAARPERRDPPARAQHRRGVQRADRAPRPAARADPELEPGVGDHRARATPSWPTRSGCCPTFLREGRTTTTPPDRVRGGHRPADRPAAPGGARAVADAPGPRQARRPTCAACSATSARSCGVEARASRRPPRRSTTRGRCSGGSTRSCASSRRSSTTSASTSARSPRSSPTTRRSPRPTARATLPALPAHPEPGQPGDPGRVSEPALHQPLEPVSGAGRLRPTWRDPPQDVRQLPLHLEPGAGAARAARRALPASIVAVLDYYAFGGTKNRGAAPPCDPQAPLGPRTNGRHGHVPAPPAAARDRWSRGCGLPKLTA